VAIYPKRSFGPGTARIATARAVRVVRWSTIANIVDHWENNFDWVVKSMGFQMKIEGGTDRLSLVG
jgi:hypothetical protein